MLGANSHSCGRGGFFLPWQKKDQGSVGRLSQMFFRRDPILKIRQPVKKYCRFCNLIQQLVFIKIITQS